MSLNYSEDVLHNARNVSDRKANHLSNQRVCRFVLVNSMMVTCLEKQRCRQTNIHAGSCRKGESRQLKSLKASKRRTSCS